MPSISDYQRAFIEFAIEREVLRFGEFTLKSGRVSPYFFNTGLFNTGAALARLGRYYAESLARWGGEFDLVFGPAYKGIPLAATVTIALAETHRRDVGYAFDRKEVKDHAEGGRVVGAPLAGRRVVVVDDVVSSGISIREAAELIRSEGGRVTAVAIALDRQERGRGEVSAVRELETVLDVPVIPVITLDDLEAYLAGRGGQGETVEAIRAYRARYGG